MTGIRGVDRSQADSLSRDEDNGVTAAGKRSRSGRLRRDEFSNQNYRAERSPLATIGHSYDESGGSSTKALVAWNDGLVVHGYFDLVPRQLQRTRHRNWTVVRKVEWRCSSDDGNRPVCRVYTEDGTFRARQRELLGLGYKRG